jgi:hypothetical protein
MRQTCRGKLVQKYLDIEKLFHGMKSDLEILLVVDVNCDNIQIA